MADDTLESVAGSIGIIGAGAVGVTLARALAARGARISAVASRSQASAESLAAVLPHVRAIPPGDMPAAADLVFLTVSDAAITPLAEALHWRAGQGVVHLSGARGADALIAVAARGAHPAALHPLMTFARPAPDVPAATLLQRLSGCTWALEADDPALASILEALVAALGGAVVRLAPEQRIPYHISGVLASNYIVTLLATATRLWQSFAAPDDALRALLPLLRGAVENLDNVGLPAALSGPIGRGDIATVASHLAWLDAQITHTPEMRSVRDAYIALAELTLPVALAKRTLSAEDAEKLRELWREPQ
ncbi:MAG TPA: DUF2520 domain-containing protein [Ktedonobacterales bacterium]|nr:DUF2520 domain-containing protein [Ktedonobacterales bacterium]